MFYLHCIGSTSVQDELASNNPRACACTARSQTALAVLTLLQPVFQCDDPASFYFIFTSVPSSGLHYAPASASVATGSGSLEFRFQT